MRSSRLAFLAGLALLAAPPSAGAQNGTLTCDSRDTDGDDGVRVCEIRETTLPARGAIVVDAEPNGSVRVHGWDGSEIRLRVRVEARGRSEDRAQELADAVEIESGGTIRARGARPGGREWWSASFELFVPRRSDLDLRSLNGSLRIDGVTGRIAFSAVNGSVRLADVDGDVRGRTTNGSLQIELSGSQWEGTGMDVRTSNGSVQLAIPEGYGARLETGTVNGTLRVDFPVTVQGRVGKELAFDHGNGGKTLRVRTTNGSVTVRRP